MKCNKHKKVDSEFCEVCLNTKLRADLKTAINYSETLLQEQSEEIDLRRKAEADLKAAEEKNKRLRNVLSKEKARRVKTKCPNCEFVYSLMKLQALKEKPNEG